MGGEAITLRDKMTAVREQYAEQVFTLFDEYVDELKARPDEAEELLWQLICVFEFDSATTYAGTWVEGSEWLPGVTVFFPAVLTYPAAYEDDAHPPPHPRGIEVGVGDVSRVWLLPSELLETLDSFAEELVSLDEQWRCWK